MRRSALPVVIVACVIVAAVLAWLAVGRMFRAAAEDAAGPPASEVRPVGEFSKLDVSGLVNLTIIQANRREVVVEAARGQASRVRSEVSGNTLRITVRPPRGKRIRDAADPDLRVVVRTPSIEAIELSGAVKLAAPALAVPALAIDASGPASIRIDALQVDSLRFVGSGAVEAELAGRATEQSISLSGAGRVRSPRLASASARVDVSGAGIVVVNAEKSLRVDLSGAGVVEYLGNPELEEHVSGLGRIKRRDSAEAAPPRARLRVA
ncbi:MAG TPA: head GIN domain-containing protein [Casimicrobiaceae bacterium]|nr:head GIN domain-containing protein [Casimicrobiaceae bacterium]